MKFEKTEVYGIKKAIYGMRNPKESWIKNDTFERYCDICTIKDCNNCKSTFYNDIYVSIGKNDLKLAQQLIRGGSEHRKFMRQIFVSVDITAPLYWWKEFDTYKVGTTANSTSTMHKIQSKPITLDCFEIDDMVSLFEVDNDLTHKNADFDANDYYYSFDDADSMPLQFIDFLEDLRLKYVATKDKRYWKELIRWLPESWLQTRTVTMTYENIYSMIRHRNYHKLNEWSGIDDKSLIHFKSWAKTLPYAEELLFLDLNKETENNELK